MASFFDWFGDPSNQGMLGLSAGLLSAGGPSRTPTSFGQAVGQGLLSGGQAYQGARQAQNMNSIHQLQIEQGQTSLANAKRTQAAVDAYAEQLPPEEKGKFLADPASYIKAMNEPYTLSPGQTRVQGGKPVASVPPNLTPVSLGGTTAMVNPATGVPSGPALEHTISPSVQFHDLGGTSGVFNVGPQGVNQIGAVPKTASPDALMSNALGRQNAAETARHHVVIEGDPTMIEQTAQAIARGDLAPLNGWALARPSGQQIMSRVVAINPEFNPTAFATRQRVENAFANGPEARSVRSFSVSIAHLGTLEQLADALHNKDTQLVNKIGNTVATQTGGTAPTNFAAAKKIVADEIVKAIVGSGGGVTDREEAAKTINDAQSPAQLKGAINTYKELMRGQLDGLRRQYKAGGGRKDFDQEFLSEEARAVAHGGGKTPGGIKFLGFENANR